VPTGYGPWCRHTERVTMMRSSSGLLVLGLLLTACAGSNEASDEPELSVAGLRFKAMSDVLEAIANHAREVGLEEVTVDREPDGRAIGLTIGEQEGGGRSDQAKVAALMRWLGGPSGTIRLGSQTIPVADLGPRGSTPRPGEITAALSSETQTCAGGYCTLNYSSFTHIFSFVRVGSGTRVLEDGFPVQWTDAVSDGFGCSCPPGSIYACFPTAVTCNQAGTPTCNTFGVPECRKFKTNNHLVVTQSYMTNGPNGPELARLETRVADNTTTIDVAKTLIGKASCPASPSQFCTIQGICTSHDSEGPGGAVRAKTASGSHNCAD
jgi:hypothetical protein